MFTFLGRQVAARQHQLSTPLLTHCSLESSPSLLSATRLLNTLVNTNWTSTSSSSTTTTTTTLTTSTTSTTTGQPFRITRRWDSSNSAAYQGDGKTTVRVLNQEESQLNLVNTYSSGGFRLHNNLFIYGSILLFPTSVFSWAVKRGADITEESLMVLDLLVPKVKIIVIGYGQYGEPYDASIALKLKKKGISCEMLATPQAVTTYNYLVHDSVHVAGAFVPVKDEVEMTRRDLYAISPTDRHDNPAMEIDHNSENKSRLIDYDVQGNARIRKLTAYRELGKKKFDD